MIHRASFRNFKALKNVDITFDSRLTVLVGPNGSGKTSVLQGLMILNRVTQSNNPSLSFNETVPGFTNFYSVMPADFQISVEADTELPQITSIGYRLYSGSECVNPNNLSNEYYVNSDTPGLVANENNIRDNLFKNIRLLSLNPKKLGSTSALSTVPPILGFDGEGLATVLAYYHRKYPDSIAQIIDNCKQIIPNLKNIRFDYISSSGRFNDLLLADIEGASGVPASMLSSGTLIVLGLLSVLAGPDQSSLLLLEDIDHDLYPKAQMNLIDIIKKLLAQYPRLQIIATSHSPYILDRLEWNEVKVTSLLDDGQAVCAPLTDHPLYPTWKDAMTPGEFWSHGAEDWVAKLFTKNQAPVTA